jgi:hypothetical protein
MQHSKQFGSVINIKVPSEYILKLYAIISI